MKIKLRQGLTLLYVSTAMLLGINEASAFSSWDRNIQSNCGDVPIKAEFDNGNSCDTCHRSSQAENAYTSGNFDYFCPAPEPTPTCTDADNDGYFAEGSDCGTLADFNDNNHRAFPGASENCTDGVDNDGNGLADTNDPFAVGCPLICTDIDGDGYNADGGECGPLDCNDLDADINPDAAENCSDGIDNNCNGMLDSVDMNAVNCPIACTDNDGDGYSIEGGECGVMDCDDNNVAVNPAELEICDDGIDNNCNNRSDDQDNVCPAPDTGGDTPAPDTGGDTPAPDTGGDTPMPDTGGDTPAPDTGGDNSGSDDQDSTPWWRNRSRDRSWWRNRSNDRDDDEDSNDAGSDSSDDDEDDAGTGSSDDDDNNSSDDDEDGEVRSRRTRRSWRR